MKTNNIIGIILLSACLCVSKTAFAQDASADETPNMEVSGTTEAMGFSRIVRNPAAAAKGFAGVASTSAPAWSSFNNAAVIPFSEKRMDVGLLYQNWEPKGIKTSNFGLGISGKFSDDLGLSLGFILQNGESYPVIDEGGIIKDEFTPKDMQVNLGVAYRFGDIVSMGVNLKYVSSNLTPDNSYKAFAGDVFAQGCFAGVNVAAGLSNIGSTIKDENGNSFKIPISVTFGADYTLTLAEVHDLNFAADFDYFLSGNVTAAIGCEYGFNDMVFARVGYHYGSEKAVLPSFASVGLGLQFFGVKLDFAYLLANEVVGNTMTIGLGYSF